LPELTLDWSRGVDGERYIEIIKPLPTTSKGRNFELRRETVGAYDKGKAGLVLEEQTLLVDADSGYVYTKMVGSAFFVGQVMQSLPFWRLIPEGGYDGPKGPKKPTWKAPSGKKPDRVSKFKTTPGQALLYRLNGDYNPLHADPTIGPKMGFKGKLHCTPVVNLKAPSCTACVHITLLPSKCFENSVIRIRQTSNRLNVDSLHPSFLEVLPVASEADFR
jgi:MaoC like domain